MKRTITIPGYGTRTLHFNSRFARILGGPSGINNAVSPNAHDIYISRHWIQGPHLAHEWGHGVDAKRLGWRYLPWVLWGYVRYGYAKSPAEVSADKYMADHARNFPPLVAP